MRNLFNTHGPGLLLALAIGAASVTPNLVAIHDMGGAFQGIYPVNGSDDLFYLARHAEILDGHYTLANPYLAEHKVGVPAPFWVPDFLLAKSGALLGLGVGESELLFDFVLPFVLALLSYAVFFALTQNRLLSVAGVAILHLGLFFEAFDRSPSPQFNFVFVLLLFYTTVVFLQSRSRWMLGFVAASFASLFYVYTYYWTYAVVLGGIWLLNLILFERRDKKLLQELGIAVAGALVLAAPALWGIVQNFSEPYYAESLARLGMIETHFPSGIAIVTLSGITILFLAVLYWQKVIERTPLTLFLLSSAAAAAVVVNQHLITGKNLEFSSHYWDVAVFGAAFAITYGVQALVRYTPDHTRTASIALVFAAMIFAAPNVYEVVAKQGVVSLEEYAWQEYAPLFAWLNTNTQEGEVVLSPSEELSAFIPIYTHNNVVFTRRANLHILSDREVHERFFVSQYWSEVDRDFLLESERSLWGVHYINRWAHQESENKVRRLVGLEEKQEPRLPEEKIEETLALHREIQQAGLEAALRMFSARYVVVDSRTEGQFRAPAFLEQAATVGSFEIYSLR